MSKDRFGLAGLALVVGGLMFFVFWVFPATEADQSLVESWPLQLAFHGAQIITLAGGLILVSALPIAGWPGRLWRIGALAAAVGTPIGLPLFAGGILLMGVGAVMTPGLRAAAVTLVPGAALWLALFTSGAMIGNEDSLPLTVAGQRIALSGLMLMTVGLVTAGVIVRRQAGVSGGGIVVGSEGPFNSSQITPVTTTPPTSTNHTGES